MSDEYKIASTIDLHRFNANAIEKGYNRALDERFMERLDPNGTHINTFSMIHEHAAGVAVDPHMRTMWLAKVTDSMKPVQIQLDMEIDEFNALETTGAPLAS